MFELSDGVERKFVDSIELDDEWEIESDSGWVPITHIHKTVEYQEWVIETEDSSLICADTHILFDENLNQVFVKDLISNKSLVMTKSGPKLVTAITQTEKHSNMFDVTVDSHEHRFYSGDFLSHNTTTTAGYMLWCVLFNSDYVIGVLANKGQLARTILDRIKKSYEDIPLWMQQGIVVWNRGNIELENGSKIFAHATSASGIRGESYNLIFMDELAHVQNNMVQDFFQSTYPVISSGKTTKVIIVSTPKGLNMFYKMWDDAEKKRSLYVPIEVHWSEVPGRDEKWKEDTIRNTDDQKFREEFECEFLGSSATLISGSKLKALVSTNPLYIQDDFNVFEEPIPGHIYISCVDCAEGVNLDYSTINIIDATQVPYRQVARYRSNKIPLLVFPTVIYSVSRKFNEAFVMVETNSIGQQVADILHYDLEYDNIFKVEQHPLKGQTISSGFRKTVTLGLRTTKSVKKIGCANLKTLIENDKLIVQDINTIAELYTFVRVKDSYAAEEGNNDDLVMGLVTFGWLAAQAYFKDSTDIDIRKILIAEQEAYTEEGLAPVGIIDDGRQEEVTYDGLDIWTEKGYFTSYL